MTPNWKNLFCVLLVALTADAWRVSFTGPDNVFTGIESKFTCVTSCTVNVECTIGWRLGSKYPSGSFSTNENGVVTWTPSKPGYQSFTCVARNATTGQSAQATKTVEVKDATVAPAVTATDTPAVTPTIPDPGSGAAQLVVTDTVTVTSTVPDPRSGAAQLTGPFALILSLGLLMVLEI